MEEEGLDIVWIQSPAPASASSSAGVCALIAIWHGPSSTLTLVTMVTWTRAWPELGWAGAGTVPQVADGNIAQNTRTRDGGEVCLLFLPCRGLLKD